MKKIILVFGCLFVANYYILNTNDCLYAAFEDLGFGVRPLGMAGAFVPLADDANALYYNPAGILSMGGAQLVTGYGKLFWGLSDQTDLGRSAVSFALPLGKFFGLGVGWHNLALNSEYQENTFLLGLSGRMSDSSFWGLNLKVLGLSIVQDEYTKRDPLFASAEDYTRGGYSGDLGMLFKIGPNLSCGLAVRDITQPDVGFSRTPVKIPVKNEVGLAYNSDYLKFALDLYNVGKDIKVNLGGEGWTLYKELALRGGISLGSRNSRQLSLGTSWQLGKFRVDYAFLFPLTGLDNTYGSHHLGLNYSFFPTLREREEDLKIRGLETEKDGLKKNLDTETATRKQLEEKVQQLEKITAESEEALKTATEENERLGGEVEEWKRKAVSLTPRPAAPKPVRYHKVKTGDTLQSLAEKYYGDAEKWKIIYEANPDKVERGLPKIDENLVIP